MLEKKQIQRLLDIAFIGCQNGRIGLARQVIEGLDQLLENSAELEICRAMSCYTVDEFEKANEILKAAHETFPHDAMIPTHMALVDLLEEKWGEAREKLDRVIAENNDPAAVKLAGELLMQCG